MKSAILVVALALAGAASAAEELVFPPEGSVSVADGLAAWDRIFEVASHPRCSNCHVGESDRPMWSGPNYGRTRVHGMNIRAGASRIGAESQVCASCHGKQNGAAPHSPPGSSGGWMLAPKEAGWFGESSRAVCEQLKDPARNGGRDYKGVARHLGHDPILRWAWAPGPGREPAPYSLEAHIEDMIAWGVAGQPCP